MSDNVCKTIIAAVISGMLLECWIPAMAEEAETENTMESAIEDGVISSSETREKANTGVTFDSDCIIDELGWVESVSSTGKSLETFYDLTGVQPFVYFKEYDASLTSDTEKGTYAENWYDENIDNEGTFLYIYFAEEDSSDEVGYMYCVVGYEISSVMDEEAIDIFWDYVEEYWYSDLSTDDMLQYIFDSTAEAIMNGEKEKKAESEVPYEGPAFKEFYWGDSKESVIDVEGENYTTGELTESDADYIQYDTTVAGMNCYLTYYFCDEGLYAVRYSLKELHLNGSDYIDDYYTLVEGVTDKYGDPIFTSDDWESDALKEEYAEDEGGALVEGYLTKTTVWRIGDTAIEATVSMSDILPSTVVKYVSQSITPEERDYSADF